MINLHGRNSVLRIGTKAGSGSGGGGGIISGSVENYAALPSPAISYAGKIYYVQNGSGGSFSVFGIYKYPKGLYTPNDSNVWELVPFNVKVSEDSLTLANITNWSEFFGYALDINQGDRLLYNDEIYVNITGSQTSTSPDLDTTNWQHANLFAQSIQMDIDKDNPSHSEGLVFYDKTKKALSYYNDESDVTVNLGQEFLIRVYNNTGSTITNGKIVYPTGVDVASGLATIDLADASVKDKCRLIGMVTHDIEDGTSGYVTRLGEVSGLNTSGMSGILYLSATTPGAYTMTKPNDGGFITAIGAVGMQDAVDGTIVVDPTISETSVEVTDTNGFPLDQRANTRLSFEDSTLTFTISSTSYPFHFYELGDKYEKSSPESVIIDDTEGLHVIYYDEGTLTSLVNPNAGQVDVVIRTKAIVAWVYWDKDNQTTLCGIQDERHGISMSPDTHAYLHFTRGARFLNGQALSDIVSDGNGDDDEDAEFSVGSGFNTDEDLISIIDEKLVSDEIPIWYKEGSSGNWRKFCDFPDWESSTSYSLGDRVLALTGNANSRGLIFQCTTAGTSGGSEPTWQDASGAVDADGGDPCGATTTDNTVTWTCIGSTKSRQRQFVGGDYRAAYNQFTGGSWQQTEVSNNDFVLIHIWATNNIEEGNNIGGLLVVIQGENEYPT
jgi:hypothetical protein